MVKMLLFVSRKEGMSPEEFRDYYVNKHIPLARSLMPLDKTRAYKQNFVIPGKIFPKDIDVDYDVVTEISWDNFEDYKAYTRIMYSPDVISKILADEAHFVKLGSVKMITVEESCSL